MLAIIRSGEGAYLQAGFGCSTGAGMLKITRQAALDQNETASNICAHLLSRLASFIRCTAIGGMIFTWTKGRKRLFAQV